jgi:chromosome transmission fidelity protein 18
MSSRKRKERDEVLEENLNKKHRIQQDEYGSAFPPTGNIECITITDSEGKRVYVTLESEEDEQNEQLNSTKPFKMLKIPIASIIENYENKIKQNLTENVSTHVKQDSNKSSENQLWVEKYSPKDFTDLITNEKTNRQILKLIHNWKTNRKIILLSGPAGLGKTTLSHILLKKAGYNPIEINASDDRTSSKLETKINTMMEVKNVFGNKKPNALIIGKKLNQLK